MIVVLNGNISSGKSAVAAELGSRLGWPVVSIDQMRRLHNPGNTRDGELDALDAMRHAIATEDNAIVEITSANSHMQRLIEAHSGASLLVLIHCPPDECCVRHRRRMDRGYELPPFPYRKSGTIEDSIYELDAIIDMLDHDLRFESMLDSASTIATELAEEIGNFKRVYG